MKQKKQWAVVAVIGMVAVLVCSLLFISNAFTGRAMAAGGEVDSSTQTPKLFLIAGPPHSVTKITADTPDPSMPGQAVTVTASVSGTGPTPTGTVDIKGADSNCTITLSGGSGYCDVFFNTKGHKTLKAVYSGDGTYNPSSATASHKVAKGNTGTTITADIPDPSDPGQPVVVDFTVNGAGVPIPTGTVVITGANTNCSMTLAGGSGSCSVTFNTAGVKTLKAQYKGDANYASSSDTESHTVNKGSPSVTITADDPDPSVPGQAVKVSVSVVGGATTPTGTVDITGADINCSTTLSGGKGSCMVVFITIGDKILTATYNGNKNYFPNMTTADHSVKNSSTTTITADNLDPSVPGETVHVDVTVSGAGASPTTTVNITGADVNCAITLAGGSGSCDAVFYTAGAKLLKATYIGDANYVGSSGTASHYVNKGSTTTIIDSDDPDPSVPYQMVTVTVTVAPVAPGVNMPSGYVAITTSGGPSVCTITLAGGTGSCGVFFTNSGTYTIIATYGGDGTYMLSLDTETHIVD